MNSSQPAVLSALSFPHFPDALSCFIFRNWNMVSPERMAATVSAPAEGIAAVAQLLGMPLHQEEKCALWRKKGYLTIIRQNWHLLTLPQLCTLLEITEDALDFMLKNEDFLLHKLGDFKPEAPELVWRQPDADMVRRYRKIGETVKRYFPAEDICDFAPFEFPDCAGLTVPRSDGLRISYLYDLPYGDPLLDDSLSAFEEKKLRSYAESGVNGLWFQALLFSLYPPDGTADPEAERRLNNLARIARRAGEYGIRIYLYFNEPRWAKPELIGHFAGYRSSPSFSQDQGWLCTSDLEVRDYLRESFRKLFARIPALGGSIVIVRSENRTHCCSHEDGRRELCPLCSVRPADEELAELLNTIDAGMAAGSPQARLLAFVWGWPEPEEKIIARLSDRITVLHTSERKCVTDCFGVKGVIGDYSMAYLGPSELALKNWRTAEKYHLRCAAKIQINNTWECSAVPYIPVFRLVEQHFRRLRGAGITDYMLSWTLGGAPSPMAALSVLPRKEVFAQLYGGNVVGELLEADDRFCSGFRYFPRSGTSCIYCGPTNYGPMNLLWREDTHRKSTMLGFPYDHLAGWSWPFPEDKFALAFRAMADGWREGLEILRRTKARIAPEKLRNFTELQNFAEAVYTHFRSSSNQIEFIRSRSRGKFEAGIVSDEITQAVNLFHLQMKDPRIGFEASNHYYYTPNLLMEKVLSCHFLLEQERGKSGTDTALKS